LVTGKKKRKISAINSTEIWESLRGVARSIRESWKRPGVSRQGLGHNEKRGTIKLCAELEYGRGGGVEPPIRNTEGTGGPVWERYRIPKRQRAPELTDIPS